MTQITLRSRTLSASAAAIAITLAGCATPRPAAPTVMALPASGESFEVFQQHDSLCRQYASTQTAGASPSQAAAAGSVGGAAVGAGVGAAAGALLGSASGHAGSGAAVGAGTGLLAGTLFGGARRRAGAASLQRHYNMTYTQCMVANGDRMAQPAARRVAYAVPYAGPIYVPPRAVYVPPPIIYPAPRVIVPVP